LAKLEHLEHFECLGHLDLLGARAASCLLFAFFKVSLTIILQHVANMQAMQNTTEQTKWVDLSPVLSVTHMLSLTSPTKTNAEER
jgi:hypothetical protein